MRVAVIGKTGQLGRALRTRMKGKDFQAEFYGRDALNLSGDQEEIAAFIGQLDKADAVIIAAAYTAVDKAEEDQETAFAVNAAAPKTIAEVCAKRGIGLVHVSTDYVFNGMGAGNEGLPYPIDAPTGPVGVYGASKREGEIGVLSANGKAAIVRTSWVFDGAGANFMTTMIRLGETREALNVVADQIGRPTYAGHLADAILAILPKVCAGQALGLYHVSGSGAPISWADFARAIFKITSGHRPHKVNVTDIPSSEYPTPARRPHYSVMDLSRFESEVAPLPSWEQGLSSAYEEWLA